MGRMKERHIYESQGYFYIDGKYVCSSCVDDYALKTVIRKKADTKRCSYCGNCSGTEEIALDINHFMEHVIDGIEFEYSRVENELAYDREEQQWIGEYQDSEDLLADLYLTENEEVQNDMIETLGSGNWWCDKDYYFYAHSPHEDAMLSWKEFSRIVKNEARYFFLSYCSAKTDTHSSTSPIGILDFIGEALKKNNMITVLKKDESIYRARAHNCCEKADDAKSLGTPPVEYASANRFSPAGVPMFYGGKDSEIVLKEIEINKSCITIGTFVANKDIYLLDLVDLPPVPSLFDKKERDKRTALLFLNLYTKEVRKNYKDNPEFEYIPTQVFSEYIRHVLAMPCGRNFDGIRYRSAKDNGKICYTLFLNPDQCKNKKDIQAQNAYLVLDSFHRMSSSEALSIISK